MKKPAFSTHIKRHGLRLSASVVMACLGTASFAQARLPESPPAASPHPAASKWHSSMAAFANADREHPPPADGVLFVGSSTIRLWSSLAQDFRQLPVVINRGFGGSTMADCDYFARELVTRYRPRQVLVYAGDNDLAEGRTPAQVLENFVNFVKVVRSELPSARIAYISIKPSPARAALLPRVREANQLLASYVRNLENGEYIDIFTPMMNASGSPRAELYGTDHLHMNEKGYAVWQSVIAGHLGLAVPLAPAAQLPQPAMKPPGPMLRASLPVAPPLQRSPSPALPE